MGKYRREWNRLGKYNRLSGIVCMVGGWTLIATRWPPTGWGLRHPIPAPQTPKPLKSLDYPASLASFCLISS